MGIIKFTEKANACFYQTAELEKIAGGYYFTEGPVWDSVENVFILQTSRIIPFTALRKGKVHLSTERKADAPWD